MATVLILMGSQSDWPTMQKAAYMLKDLGVSWEAKVVSAHRTPDLLKSSMEQAEKDDVKVVIAGAGGAAHLPGMLAAHTSIPVLGVPVSSKQLKGLDSLLSIVQMPKGVAVGTLAIGDAGAANAGLLAAQIVGSFDATVRQRVTEFRNQQRDKVMANADLELPE
ncbi:MULTISPECIES: 5-(carboxyamino)imidazole ribonucleotide mutase [Idiomarina]|jgi:5-(carboxyamino)imidazole ribonucleotide mutase|uniref:N5-carboxyaminoimidazole ribonucleotide mutase n=2 Tax=Idiomarina baltica TaxID=190892 RepID=A0A348WL71_9GAMM|nr:MULTISPECIES: 5-(carboxyamino)imidazole ribonucleotide mutase [Idiomarina]MAF75277.1 5-(carboxyamino)imidazole ribonucleotide mutase [Idiomarinaceae bacterium]MEC8926347.1 5-(carboxyamino)imidazole ribonucleotide mutase [Pseudomonadota bacterium]EAQ33327.1 Phosphoribosylcarboxyaminoimidazole (NCAIR) mutase [Idiomarina baltica OS145]KXS34643.1 MAG: N5-carboxyaminoimidazole ribonucleotide mutase [Idiomarina sp. T82-3]MBL74645.1 5-(carboxyamino)imidazole ribonucleotide mutase [Idiomarinaceae b|tara:strand:- start:359 stop:850 length:492 start_codon:yes stop_codon:yes gene_type:complete